MGAACVMRWIYVHTHPGEVVGRRPTSQIQEETEQCTYILIRAWVSGGRGGAHVLVRIQAWSPLAEGRGA